MAHYLDWLVAHQVYFWLALALACNIARRLRSDAQLVAAAERTRVGLAIAAAVRFFGLDPVGAVQLVAAALNAKAATEAARSPVAGLDALPPTLRPGLPPGGAGGAAGGAEGSDPRGVSL